jgi:hypothetical protein
MVLLLALVLAVDGGTPVPRVHVYRSRAELPKAWAAEVPKDFDFSKEMLAGETDGVRHVTIAVPMGVVHEGAATHVQPAPELDLKCPPCSGIRPSPEGPTETAPLTPRDLEPRATLYRLPKAPGVVVVDAVVVPNVRCSPCTAP